MPTHAEHADMIDRFAQLIAEHEELKRQYDDLQTNFHLLASKKMNDILIAYAEMIEKKKR